jgi:hypothetical protein
MRALSVVTLAVQTVAAIVPLVLVSGCPTGSLIGQPCEEAGEEQCEGDQNLRCDGTVWTLLAECSYKCIDEKAVIEHSGPIQDDETWTCAEGPHLVKETMTVGAGHTLTIEKGALVRMVASARINTDVAGRIEANGDENAPILVTSDSGDAPGFGGATEGGLNVFAVTTGEPSVIVNTIIERGTHGLGVFNIADGALLPVVENNTLRDNAGYGIIISCSGDAPAVPDFRAAGNQFFKNETGEVSPCDL